MIILNGWRSLYGSANATGVRSYFLAAVPASAFVKEIHGVTLNAHVLSLWEEHRSICIKLNSGVAEFDLVAPTHQAASQVRIATGTAVKAIAKPITTEVYSNYGDHSNTGYLREYSDHSIMAMIIHKLFGILHKGIFYQAYYGAGKSHRLHGVLY